MINLLPHDIKTNYRFARRNVGLRRWVVAFVIALFGLGAIGTYGLLTLHQQNRHFSQQISASQAMLKKENFTGTQAEVKTISNNFKLVLQVLSNEVLFSDLIKQIAATIPANA